MSRTGLESIHGGTCLAGFGAGAGGFLGVEEVGEELGLGEDFAEISGGLLFGVFIGWVRHFLLSFWEGRLGLPD